MQTKAKLITRRDCPKNNHKVTKTLNHKVFPLSLRGFVPLWQVLRIFVQVLILILAGVSFTSAFARPAISSSKLRASNAVLLVTPTPASEDEAAPSGPPLSLTLSLLCFCLVFGLLIGVFVLGVIVRRPASKDTDIEKAKHEHGL